MKSEKRILIAFVLNLFFSVFEILGGLYTGSAAIISDAVHDMGDAASIGIAFALEKKSKKQPDNDYTYGYARYSVLGGVITSMFLLFGSVAVIYNSAGRIITPSVVEYDGMLILAVIGIAVNFVAAFFTSGGHSHNQKAVNLHMLEDVLGWAVVFVGAVVIKHTGFYALDSIMSVGVAVFILINAVGNLREAVDIFLEKTPKGMDVDEIKKHLADIEGVLDVHHIHIRSIDGRNNYATMHIVADGDFGEIKEAVRKELREHGIVHATLELETEEEVCRHRQCRVEFKADTHHHHHHH